MLLDITNLGLTPAIERDLSMILPFMETGEWQTSQTIRIAMMQNHSHFRKQMMKVSGIMAKLYHYTDLFDRKEAGRIYFHGRHKRSKPLWGYRLNKQSITEQEYLSQTDD